MKNTPNAVTSVGMMMAPTVPVQPNCRMRMNSGMMPSWVGMAMVATTNTMSALLLRNRSLANAKPDAGWLRVCQAAVPEQQCAHGVRRGDHGHPDPARH